MVSERKFINRIRDTDSVKDITYENILHIKYVYNAFITHRIMNRSFLMMKHLSSKASFTKAGELLHHKVTQMSCSSMPFLVRTDAEKCMFI